MRMLHIRLVTFDSRLQEKYDNIRFGTTLPLNSLSALARIRNSSRVIRQENQESRYSCRNLESPPTVTPSYIFTDLYGKLANRSPAEMVVGIAKRARLQLYLIVEISFELQQELWS